MKIISVVAAYLRMQSIRLEIYLDDCLAMNVIWRILLQDPQRRLNVLSQLGFLINAENSQLMLTQDINCIGRRFLLVKCIFFPTLDRVSKLRETVMEIRGTSDSTVNSEIFARDLFSRNFAISEAS